MARTYVHYPECTEGAWPREQMRGDRGSFCLPGAGLDLPSHPLAAVSSFLVEPACQTPAQLTKKTRDRFKMRRRKRLSAPPPLTQQSTTTYEGIPLERDLKTRLRVSTMKVKGSLRMGRAARERVSRKKTPRPSPGDPPLGGVTEGWAFSLRSKGWKLRTWRPRSWTLTRETNPLTPGFGEWKESCKTAGNRKSAPKRYACGLTQPKNHHESARSKGTWSMSEGNPLTHLELSPREAGTSRAAPQGLSHRWRRFCHFRLPR